MQLHSIRTSDLEVEIERMKSTRTWNEITYDLKVAAWWHQT